MNNQISILGILVKNFSKIAEINALLHTYSSNIISRSGMPYKEKNLRLINIILESSPQTAQELNNKLSVIDGVSAKLMSFELS